MGINSLWTCYANNYQVPVTQIYNIQYDVQLRIAADKNYDLERVEDIFKLTLITKLWAQGIQVTYA